MRKQREYTGWTGWSAALLSLVALLSCEPRRDLELHPLGQIIIDTPLPEVVDLKVIWDVNWTADWEYEWDEEKQGIIGYSDPESFHVDYFATDDGTTNLSRGVRDFMGSRTRIQLDFGLYNLLFFNNDYEYIRVTHAETLDSVTATTSETKARVRSTGEEKVKNMPEQLFSVYTQTEITNRMKDYTWDEEEQCYVKYINATLDPRVFIYLVQVKLLNNRNRVTGGGVAEISGLANTCELISGMNGKENITVQYSMRYQQQIKAAGDTLDLLGGRMTTFGLCEITPWKTRSEGLAVTRTDVRNQCSFAMQYRNGADTTVTVDITEQMRSKLTGGVIRIELNVDDYSGPMERPAGGGFDTKVDDWGEKNHHFDI